MPNLSVDTAAKSAVILELPDNGTVVAPSGSVKVFFAGDIDHVPDLLQVELLAIGSTDPVIETTSDTTSVTASMPSAVVVSRSTEGDSVAPLDSTEPLLPLDVPLAGDSDPAAVATEQPATAANTETESSPEPVPTDPLVVSPSPSPDSTSATEAPVLTPDPTGTVDAIASEAPDVTAQSGTETTVAPSMNEPGTASRSSATWEIQSPYATGNTAVLSLPDLGCGLYRITCTASKEGTILETRSSLLFVEKALPDIVDVQVYPGVVKAGVDGLFYVEFTNVNALGMLVRWESSQGLIADQNVYGGTSQLQFKAPDRKGVYSYTVSLFPRLPQGVEFDFDAPVRKTFTVVVAEKTLAGMNDLKPGQDFPVLLHFNGDMEDAGTLASTRSTGLKLVGAQNFMLDGRHFGYQLGSGGYLSAESVSLFEKNALTGTMSAFSAVIETSFLDAKAGTVFSTKTANNDVAVQLLLDGAGYLVVEFRYGSLLAAARSKVPIGTGAYRLFLGAAINNGVMDVVVSSGGELLGQGLCAVPADYPLPASLAESSDAAWLTGKTVVGSLDGPRFILDEFGMYAPAELASVTDPFYLSMRFSWGSGLVLAESFVAPLIKTLQVEGDVRLSNGKLIMPQGASLRLPRLALGNKELTVTIGIAEGNRADAILSFDNADAPGNPVVLSSSGSMGQGSSVLVFPPRSQKFDVRLSRNTQKPALVDVKVGKAVLSADLGKGNADILVTISSNSSMLAELQIDYLLALFKDRL